eukprot:TRINITY_DN1671_c0_g1_i2.p1 TRINITY_DN1671_c0_g1~~TRINITY_DN1671_c0_g1_i2.p1  ORF type:complete len:284 (+),score=16.53 TRINITY_DN1671_c0_g1_i2:55-906(+)
MPIMVTVIHELLPFDAPKEPEIEQLKSAAHKSMVENGFRTTARIHFNVSPEVLATLPIQGETMQRDNLREHILDTHDYALLQQGYWLLRKIQTFATDPPKITYELRHVIRSSHCLQFTYHDTIMDKLAEILGKNDNVTDELSYCPHVVLALKTTRLYVDGTKAECWIDISSWFSHGKAGMYIVGTLVVNSGLDQISQCDKLELVKDLFKDKQLHWMPSKYFVAMYDLSYECSEFQKTFTKEDIDQNLQHIEGAIIRDGRFAKAYGHKMTTLQSFVSSLKKAAK